MNARRVLLLTIGLLVALTPARADELKPLRQLGKQALTAFEDHKDAEGRQLFQAFLEQVNASESALRDTQIEVIIGVLGCAVGDKQMGREALDYVLENGKGIRQIRATLKQVRAACSGADAVAVPAAATMNFVLALASGGPGVSGKGGASFTPVPSLTVTHIEPAELEKRLQETEKAATALAPTLARYPGHGTVTDHFIVVSDGPQNWAEGVAACLERYRVILSRDFDMVTPEHRITVYNSQWGDRIYHEAARLHGLELPPGTIAYSVYADLSMVGEGAPNGCGSLAHELVHLMIKSNFADAPAWLEEGLASAVALSVPEGGHLSFRPGWRDEVLRTRWELRPSVENLLSLSWDDFSPAQGDNLQRVAAVQAMASVFARYLAARNKLQQVYFGVRKQDLRADLRDHHTRQQVLEKELGKSVAEVDSDFAEWFRKDSLKPKRPQPPGKTREASAKPCESVPAANAAANAAADVAQQQPVPCPPEAKK
jgi:hypothetical protein